MAGHGHHYADIADPKKASKHMTDTYLKSIKETSLADAEYYQYFHLYLRDHHLKEPVAKPVDPRMPNMTLMVTRFGYDDCSFYQKGQSEIIQATAIPVCFEFPDHEPFASVTVNAKLSNMAWDETGGPLRDGKCKIVMYEDKTCHSAQRMQAYMVCSHSPYDFLFSLHVVSRADMVSLRTGYERRPRGPLLPRLEDRHHAGQDRHRPGLHGRVSRSD
jgi:hypothetical protein